MKIKCEDTYIELIPENAPEKVYLEKFQKAKLEYNSLSAGGIKTLSLILQ